MKLIDEIIPEPLGGAHRNVDLAARALKSAVIKSLDELEKVPIAKLLDRRYKKFRGMGVYKELQPAAPEAGEE